MPNPKECDDAVKWLDENFLRSFKDDVDPALWSDIPNGAGVPRQRGFFAITVLSLIYCNAMAALKQGKAKAGTKVTIEFIEKDVGAAAGGSHVALYRERGAFLYSIFRHRLVHQREPGGAKVGATTIKWVMARSPQDEEWVHLRYHERPKGTFRFWVHADALQKHALAAFEAVRAKIDGGDDALAKNILQGAKVASSAQPLVKDDLGAYVMSAISSMLAKPDTDKAVLDPLEELAKKMGW